MPAVTGVHNLGTNIAFPGHTASFGGVTEVHETVMDAQKEGMPGLHTLLRMMV